MAQKHIDNQTMSNMPFIQAISQEAFAPRNLGESNLSIDFCASSVERSPQMF